MLESLTRWIGGLEPQATGAISWTTYASTNTHTDDEAAAKCRFVSVEFVPATKPRLQKPRLLVDVGCNTGDYSVVALDAGAQSVTPLKVTQRLPTGRSDARRPNGFASCRLS